MAIWAKKTGPKPPGTISNVINEHDELLHEFLGDLTDLGGTPTSFLSPPSGSIPTGTGDETEEYPLPEYRPTPQQTRTATAEVLRQRVLYGAQPGDQRGLVVRYRMRNGPRMLNAPVRGGDIKPTLISEEKLQEWGWTDNLGNPVNLTPNGRSILPSRCTCLKYI